MDSPRVHLAGVAPVPPQTASSAVPWANRWDVVPLLGTPIGALRIVYGIFTLAIGLLLACCLGSSLSKRALDDIGRGWMALASFLPSVRAAMEEENKRLYPQALPPAPPLPAPPPSGGNGGSSNGGGNGVGAEGPGVSHGNNGTGGVTALNKPRRHDHE